MDEWIKQPEWHGNPALGYDCWKKMFSFHIGAIPVYVWGPPDSNTLHFTVSAGASSDFSYTGCFFPQKLTWQETIDAVDEKFKRNKLIY